MADARTWTSAMLPAKPSGWCWRTRIRKHALPTSDLVESCTWVAEATGENLGLVRICHPHRGGGLAWHSGFDG